MLIRDHGCCTPVLTWLAAGGCAGLHVVRVCTWKYNQTGDTSHLTPGVPHPHAPHAIGRALATVTNTMIAITLLHTLHRDTTPAASPMPVAMANDGRTSSSNGIGILTCCCCNIMRPTKKSAGGMCPFRNHHVGGARHETKGAHVAHAAAAQRLARGARCAPGTTQRSRALTCNR